MDGVLALLRSLRRNLLGRRSAEWELDAELRAYVSLLTDEKVRAGMSPREARRAALIECRGVDQVKERVRESWVGERLVTGVREVRVVLRSLLRSPGYLLVSVATLAIGLGGATAVFTVIAGSLLRPLPGASEPDRLVSVERVQRGRTIAWWSYPDYRDLRDRSRTLEGLATYDGTSMALEDATGSTSAWVSFVSDDFFEVLGVRPAMGRVFGPSDAGTSADGGDEVAVLGYDLWQRRYGGSNDVIGARVDLDGHPFTVIGVAPRGFIGAMAQNPMEMWIPVVSQGRVSPTLAGYTEDLLTSRRLEIGRLVGRLAPGATVEDAKRELAAVADWLASVHPTNRERSARVFPGAGMTAEERVEASRIPRLLAMAVGLLLLIACANVAGLVLVRSTSRRQELATRLALGASRAALVRQVALEGSVLSILAGGAGVLLAEALVRSATLVGTVVPIPDLDLTIDGRVLAVALAASVLTALGVSLIPALRVLRVPAGAVLRDGARAVGRTSAGARGQRAVVTVQVAASLVLLAASAMIFSSFQRVLSGHGDVDPRGIADGGWDVVASIPEPRERLSFYRAVLASAESEPDLAAAALTSTIPPFDWASHAAVFRRGEEPPRSELVGRETELGTRASVVTVSEGFFEVMRIAIERGRGFAESDDERSEPVAILSRRLADALWPDQDPVGRYVAWPAVEGPDRPPLRVIGVVADTRPVTPVGDPLLSMYVPFSQRPRLADLILVVRTRGNAPADAAMWRRIADAAAPGMEVGQSVMVVGGGVRTLFDRLASELRPQRTASAWVGVFGTIALLLSALGVYGVLAQAVLQRMRELAIRSVLGATPADILAAVLGEGLRLAAAGGALGVLGMVAAFRVVRSIFPVVAAVDVTAAVAAVGLLAAAMITATYAPARRAARLDPAATLRCD